MYILVKGCNGFGNMMSILSFAYYLAKNNNLTLVIDWEHPEWKLGFDSYFKLHNIKYLSYSDFEILIANNNLTIYPSLFNKDNIHLPLSKIIPSIDTSNMYGELFNPVIKILSTNDSKQINMYGIYVFSYNWLGYEHIKLLWSNLELQPKFKLEINNKIKDLGEYNAMHVRHTDNKNISCAWVTDYIKENIDKKIYIATDNEIILDICKKIHPNIINYTHFYEKGKPLHLQMNISDIDKDRINIDTITDMYILINAKEMKITPIKTHPYMTTYSLLALYLRP
jgi:hypothetical protein